MLADDQLESALQATWNRETLAVYADRLIDAGDPRGELIAIDLALETQDRTPEIAGRRRELVNAWLGAPLFGRPWSHRQVKYGFVQDYVIETRTGADYLTALLESPAGRHIRGLTIEAEDTEQLEKPLATLTAHARPWLERLVINVSWQTREPPTEQRPLGRMRNPTRLSGAATRDLIAATPYLRTLELELGRLGTLFDQLDHPSLRSLSLQNPSDWRPDRMPAITKLALRSLPFVFREATALVSPTWFPGLRELDLSSLFVGSRDFVACAFLESIDTFPELTRVRIPPVRQRDLAQLHATLLRLPPGIELEVVRAYADSQPSVDDPRLRIPLCSPWPAPAIPLVHRMISIKPPGDRIATKVGFNSCIEILDQEFAELSAAERAAWTDLWAVIAPAARVLPRVHRFSFDTLRCALDGIEGMRQRSRRRMHDGTIEYLGRPGDSSDWALLRDQLRALRVAPGAEVEIEVLAPG